MRLIHALIWIIIMIAAMAVFAPVGLACALFGSNRGKYGYR